MTTYTAQTGPSVGRPPCAACGAAYRLHRGTLCPTAYRPDDLVTAYRELKAAYYSGDQTRIFVARGNVQHLGGDPDAE